MFGAKEKDKQFFAAFTEHADLTAQAAELLMRQFQNPEKAEELAFEIGSIEHRGDKIVHDTMNALRATWITPFDRGDIHDLISSLDDLLDLIHAVSVRSVMFELKSISDEVLEMTRGIVAGAETIKRAVPLLSNLKRSEEILKFCEELNKIEHDGDVHFRHSVAKLFKSGLDPLEIMKWREIYEDLETALDRCQDVGDAIGGVVLEYA